MIDILSDAKRRQRGNSVASPKGGLFSRLPDTAAASRRAVNRVLCAADNIEFILKNVGGRRNDSQDNDQPDYDSVASDEDTDQDLPSSKGDRTKVLSLQV